MNCPFCDRVVESVVEDFHSGQFDRTGNEILVPNITWFRCKHPDCQHSWLPIEEERKIDVAMLERKRGK